MGIIIKKLNLKKKLLKYISESSNIIDDREFDIEKYDEEDEQQKTLKKTMDIIKIFPCKLISEITKPLNET